MKNLNGKVALITGAAGGLGQAQARVLMGYGCKIVATDLDGDAAQQLAQSLGGDAIGLQQDVTDPDGWPRVVDAAYEAFGRFDVLVNNAGVLDMGAFIAQETATLSRMITLNTLALTELASHFVPPMAARRSGRVLNVASVAAFQPVPSLAVYAATKAFVLSLTESLAEELKPHGVSVTALCPGITETGMFTTIKDANEKTSALPDFLVADVQDVAQEGYDACMKADVVRVPGLAYAMSTSLGRAAPRWVTRLVAGAIGRQMM